MRTTAMTAPRTWKNEDFFLEIIMHDGTKACILHNVGQIWQHPIENETHNEK